MADGFKNILGEERVQNSQFQTGNTVIDAVFTDWFFEVSAPAVGTQMQINIGDVWKVVTSIQINIGDAWKPAVSVKQNIGDAWKTVF